MDRQPRQSSPNVVTSKTCARCGRGFGAYRREYLCSNCRKPALERALNPHLSFREKQVVRLVQQAKSNKEIAFELCLTVGTVKEYLYRIFRKLRVANRTELALRGGDLEVTEASRAS